MTRTLEAAERQRLERAAADRTRALNEAVARLKAREADLSRSRAEAIRRLAAALEFRDGMTGEHVERMSRYCGLLGERLGLGPERCDVLRLASQLHDIGKIAVPDRVLSKRGPLTGEERALIESHPKIGHEMLSGSGEPLLDLAATIALTHHERVDGGGYPRGLRGAEIPIEGRIAMVADVFDALMSDRPYRPALSLSRTLVEMRSERGAAFDPEVLDAFLSELDQVVEMGGLGADPAAQGLDPTGR